MLTPLRRSGLALLSVGVAVAWVAAQPNPQPNPQSNPLPNPYHRVDNWFKVPPGFKWSIIAAVAPDAQDNLWVVQRQDPPILKFDKSGVLVKTFGDGLFALPHGLFIDREGFLWVPDSGPFGERGRVPGKGFQVFKFDQDGKLLMTLGKPNVPQAGPDTFLGPTGVVINGSQWIPSTEPSGGYRGLVLFGDKSNSWVGTRSLWNEHTYHVSNICDDRDNACPAPNVYGSFPAVETRNWTLPWLNDFRQNVQDKGLFDAPDPTVALTVDCTTPVVAHVQVRNVGSASLPAGVTVGVYVVGSPDVLAATGTTTHVLFPGQVETVDVTVPAAKGSSTSTFRGAIVIDPNAPLFHECRADNDATGPATARCTK